MKVFVGFGYNENDKWIRQLILPLIETFKCDVLNGEEIQGEILTQGVKDKINESDVFIGFYTKRGNPDSSGMFGTHKWVIQEAALAIGRNIPCFIIREKGVDPQQGMDGNRQYFEYSDNASVMLEVAKFISKEKLKIQHKEFLLLPDSIIKDLRTNENFAKCSYSFYHNGKEYEPTTTKLRRTKGGYFIVINQIPDEKSQVQIIIDSPGGSWKSEFVSVSQMNIELQKVKP